MCKQDLQVRYWLHIPNVHIVPSRYIVYASSSYVYYERGIYNLRVRFERAQNSVRLYDSSNLCELHTYRCDQLFGNTSEPRSSFFLILIESVIVSIVSSRHFFGMNFARESMNTMAMVFIFFLSLDTCSHQSMVCLSSFIF